jgi:hypothetical protein
MTPKGWTQEETIALLIIVHMSTELDGPKTDEDLANILNQKVAQGHLKRNLNTDNPFNKLIVRQRVYNLMENGIVPTIGQMRVKRRESPNMRPEEVTAWFAAEAGFHFIPQEQDVSSINGKQSLAMQPSPSSQPIPPLQQSYVPGNGWSIGFWTSTATADFLATTARDQCTSHSWATEFSGCSWPRNGRGKISATPPVRRQTPVETTIETSQLPTTNEANSHSGSSARTNTET